MLKKKKYKITTIPLSQLFPNAITMLALCLGITAVRYSLDAKFDISAILIIIASIMDGLDGRIARFLNATTAFGAHLDSLTDLVSFGVAPAIVIYLWSLHLIPYKGIGWAIILVFIACAAFRLARFNISLGSPIKNFFTGIPMPAAACLAITPMIASFKLINLQSHYWLVASYVLIVGLLMVSKIPTFSTKHLKIKKECASPMLALMAIVMALILLTPWYMLPILAVLYVLSIFVSVFLYYKNSKR